MKRLSLFFALALFLVAAVYFADAGGRASSDAIFIPPWGISLGDSNSSPVRIQQSGTSTAQVTGNLQLTGVFKQYNGATLVGNGFPSFTGQYSNASFHAAVTTKSILAVSAASASLYKVAWSISQLTSGAAGTCATAATATPTIAWTDPAGNSDSLTATAVSLPATMAACTAANTGCGYGNPLIQVGPSSAITIAVAWADGNCTTQPTAQLFANAETMN